MDFWKKLIVMDQLDFTFGGLHDWCLLAIFACELIFPLEVHKHYLRDI